MEVYAGGKAHAKFNTWLPDETVEAFRDYLVGIKGPLTTPVGGGIRSLNVALRQMLDLYVCLRPVRWFKGVPSPVKHPEKVDMVIFRENTEDIYAGHRVRERQRRRQEAHRRSSRTSSPTCTRRSASRRPRRSASSRSRREGTERLIRAAIEYAIEQGRKSVTLVHKGNIMKFTPARSATGATSWPSASSATRPTPGRSWERTKAEQGRGRRQRRAEGRLDVRQDPDQGRHRRHHPPAGADPARASST